MESRWRTVERGRRGMMMKASKLQTTRKSTKHEIIELTRSELVCANVRSESCRRKTYFEVNITRDRLGAEKSIHDAQNQAQDKEDEAEDCRRKRATSRLGEKWQVLCTKSSQNENKMIEGSGDAVPRSRILFISRSELAFSGFPLIRDRAKKQNALP